MDGPNRTDPVASSSRIDRSDRDRKKEKRATFDEETKKILADEFEKCKYPNADGIEKIALKINFSCSKVSVWFKNERARARKGGTPVEKYKPKVLRPIVTQSEDCSLSNEGENAPPDSEQRISSSESEENPAGDHK